MENNSKKMLYYAAKNTRGESMEGPHFNRPDLSWTLAEHQGKHSKPKQTESSDD